MNIILNLPVTAREVRARVLAINGKEVVAVDDAPFGAQFVMSIVDGEVRCGYHTKDVSRPVRLRSNVNPHKVTTICRANGGGYISGGVKFTTLYEAIQYANEDLPPHAWII